MAKRRLSLILHSADYGRIHYGFVMAAAATATDRPVTLFFTMGAIHALTPGWGRANDSANAEKGIATLAEMIAACAEFEADFQICDAGLKSEGLMMDDLRPDIAATPGGMVSFLAEAERDNAQIVFI